MGRGIRLMTAMVSLGLLLSAASASAQWVMVAKAVSGRVQQMSHKSSDGNGYDVATVVLEANAAKVYSTALSALKSHEGIKITNNDDKTRRIDFTNGTEYASLQATPLGDKITQLVIASNLAGAQPSATSLVLQGVLKVCKDMNVDCTVEGN